MARVNLADGSHVDTQIVEKTYDGHSWTGFARWDGKRIPVSQSTTVHNADGKVTKEWDEIVQREIPPPLKEEEW